MTGVSVFGWSALTSAGTATSAAPASLPRSDAPVAPGTGGLFTESLPSPRGHVVPGFDIRARLGRKGTSTYDRATGLAVVCCEDALGAAELAADADRGRVGVVLGTTIGSFRSTSDFSRETLVQEKPYLVNPMLFPNTVMNGAAGQVAIRHGLRGVNATVAGGALGFLNAVRYAEMVLAGGYADVMLAGAVEEFSAHRAWAAHLTGTTAEVPLGEAAAVFVLSAPQPPAWVGAAPVADLVTATGFGPGGTGARALLACARRALDRAGVAPSDVTAVLTGEADEAGQDEYLAVAGLLRHRPRRVAAKRLLGECDAASSAAALAVWLADPEPAGPALLTARNADGAVAVAVVRRCADAGTGDR
ncbi:beta-ketoacyl synthase N-terminal-like domain-containing protein [Micromonospora sp. DT15]|uniref:beta-ketoacyl synthase N-terminal-like domain-containing protein n=1 Tax=Micromonospora sp. DT15 TaxID=3393445 RepID=UPI003CE7FE48